MAKVILAYCVENQFAAAKIVTALASKAEVEKVVFDTYNGIKLLEKHIQNHTHPVLLLISDNFLKSENCMSEALGIIQTLGNQKRLIPVTTEGVYAKDKNTNFVTVTTSFDRVSNVIQYMNHWQDCYLELRRSKPMGMDDTRYTSQVSLIRSISSEVGEMLRYLRAMEYYSFDQFVESNFVVLYRILGVNTAEAGQVKNTYVPTPTFETERFEEVSQKVQVEKLHIENGHSAPKIEAIVAPALESQIEKVEIKKEIETPIQIQHPIAEPVSETLDKPLDKEHEPINLASDFNAFETPATLEALIEDIKKDTRYLLEPDETEGLNAPDLNKVIDEVVHENDKKADEIIELKESKPLEDIKQIFAEDKKEDTVTLLEDVYKPIENQPIVEKPIQKEPIEEISIKEELTPIAAEKIAVTEISNADIQIPETEAPTPKLNGFHHVDRIEDTTPTDTLPENEPMKNDYLELAHTALEHHQYNDAIEHLEFVIAQDRTNIEAYMMMAFAAEQMGDYLLSLSCLEKVTLVQPNYPSIYYKLGTLINQHFKGQKRKAIRYFSDSVKYDPTNAEAHFQLAKLEMEDGGGDYELVIAHLNDTLKHNPQHAEAAYELAKVYIGLDKKEEASAFYARAWSVDASYKTDENDEIFKYEPPAPEPEPIINDNGITVLITGATSGIGRATAEVFAEHGYRLILTGRRSEKLEELKSHFDETHHNKNLLINFDVRDIHAVKNAIANLSEEFKNVDILINNAGLASGLAPIHEGDINDWELMIDTNIKGLLYMTRAVAPHMVARRKGHIINISSVAGKEVYPNGNVYNASKHAVDALTRSMRLDLHKHNIRVSQVAPGAVEETEFALVRFHGDAEKAKIYNDFTPLKAKDVAETIYFIASRPEYVNIQDIVLMGLQQASANHLDRSGRIDV